MILHGHEDSVTGVAFSPDGTCIASTAADQTVQRGLDTRPRAPRPRL